MKAKALPLIAPSLLSADFAQLRKEIADVEAAGADWLHIDVMDGHFVPNLTIGPPVVKSLRKVTRLPLDCHLMVSRPEDWVGAFRDAGASVLTVHAEATKHLDRLLHRIREAGMLAGVSVNPATPLSAIEEVLPVVDLVLVMSVNPGFGGQQFIPAALRRIERLADARGGDLRFQIQVDGGVDASNAGALRRAGADVLVAGSAIFGQKNRRVAVKKLREAAAK